MFSGFKQGKRNKGGKSSRWHFRLKQAWCKNKNCHYCGVETVIEDRFCNGRHQKDNAATLDHVYSNLDLRRLLSLKTVLSCYRCNNKRSAAEVRKVYPNRYDKRNNKVSIVEILKSGEMPKVKQCLSRSPQ